MKINLQKADYKLLKPSENLFLKKKLFKKLFATIFLSNIFWKIFTLYLSKLTFKPNFISKLIFGLQLPAVTSSEYCNCYKILKKPIILNIKLLT